MRFAIVVLFRPLVALAGSGSDLLLDILQVTIRDGRPHLLREGGLLLLPEESTFFPETEDLLLPKV